MSAQNGCLILVQDEVCGRERVTDIKVSVNGSRALVPVCNLHRGITNQRAAEQRVNRH